MNLVDVLQGNEVVEAKESAHTSGGVQVGQCFYRMADYSDSVTLEFRTPETSGAARPG